MLTGKHISHLVDYTKMSTAFPGVDFEGGVGYFLWDKSHQGDCKYTLVLGDEEKPGMTPAPQDVLGEIAKALLREVGPHVPDAYALSVLQRSALLLQVVAGRMDTAAHALFEENAALHALFARAYVLVRDEAMKARLAEAQAGASAGAADLSVLALETVNAKLRALLIALHAHAESDPALVALEQEIWRELAASTGRRRGAFDRF